MKTRSTYNLIGAAGEYYVCAELCKLGFLALLTPKNNPLFDVVATAPDGLRSVSIQVKTRSVQNEQGWKFGIDVAKEAARDGLFIVLVNLKKDTLPEFYVYESRVLSERVSKTYQDYISKRKKDGTSRKEVNFRWFDEASFCDDDKARKDNWAPIVNSLQQVM